MSKNSSALQSEGALNGKTNCWHQTQEIYSRRNKVTDSVLPRLTVRGVPVAMVNNSSLDLPMRLCFVRDDVTMTALQRDFRKINSTTTKTAQMNTFSTVCSVHLV